MVENALNILVDCSISDELWMHIFSWCVPKDLLQNAVLVSKRFSHLLSSQQYWKYNAEKLLELWNEEEMKRLSVRQLQVCCLLAAQVRLLQSSSSNNSNVRDNTGSSETTESEDAQTTNRLSATATAASAALDRSLKSLLPFREAAESIRQHPLLHSHSLAQQQQQQPRRRVCLASSTDHYSEILEHVLTPVTDIIPFVGRMGLGAAAAAGGGGIGIGIGWSQRKWWSSKASDTQHSSETLVFALNCPLAMVHGITLRPLLDPYTRDRIYTWAETEIKAYRLPLAKLAVDLDDDDDDDAHDGVSSSHRPGFPCTIPVETTPNRRPNHQNNHQQQDEEELEEEEWTQSVDSETDQRAIDALLQNEHPVYSSERIPTRQQPQSQTATILHQNRRILQDHIIDEEFTMPLGTIANAICITLHGKHQRQFESSGYYACLEQVTIKGVPLVKLNYSNHIYL